MSPRAHSAGIPLRAIGPANQRALGRGRRASELRRAVRHQRPQRHRRWRRSNGERGHRGSPHPRIRRAPWWLRPLRGPFGHLPGPFGDPNVPSVIAVKEIGTGFAKKTDPAALVIGPTGVGLGRRTVCGRYGREPDPGHSRGLCFGRIAPGPATTVTEAGALNSPLGLAMAPNGDILTANAGDGNVVETSPNGTQFPPITLDENGEGTLFGLAVARTVRPGPLLRQRRFKHPRSTPLAVRVPLLLIRSARSGSRSGLSGGSEIGRPRSASGFGDCDAARPSR